MRDPRDLYEQHGEAPEPGLVLVHAFTGFLDAGLAVHNAAAHILATCPGEAVVTFDTDELLDYRARRPRMTYDTDHFSAVDIPTVAIRMLRDADDQPFLFLTGPEPDYQWQRFTAAMLGLVDDWSVRLTVGLSGIPWPAPHTRPPSVTRHSSSPELIEGSIPLVGQIEVPGHVGGLLELELGRTGHLAMGIATHVPHYLAQFDYPRSAISLVQSLEQAAGLSIPSDALEPSALRVEEDIASQVAASDEFGLAVRTLEEQYDAIAALQSADIASQVESFLAQRASDEGQG